MRKRSIIKSRFLCAAVLAVLCVLIACFIAFRPSVHAGERAQKASTGLNDYAYDLIFRPEDSALHVTMTLQYANNTGGTLNDLVLRTWANAYASEETSPAAIDELYDLCYPNGFSGGSLSLEGIWWNDTVVTSWQYDDHAQTALRIPIDALSPGESGALLLRCRLTVPECAHRFGFSQGVWQFGNALPILSVYENGAWRTDAYCAIGDPFVSECANYTVSITVPEGWQCAASAAVNKDGQRFTMYAPAARDFAFALSQNWQTAASSANGIAITAYAKTKNGAKRAAQHAASALKTYSTLYGDYAWQHFTVCEADFPLGGMEYPGLILLDQRYFYEDWQDTLELLIAHETAHQWFYGLVGSDQYHHPWQDEALCEYATLQYAKKRHGQTAYENLLITRIDAPMQENILAPVTPGSPIDHYGSYSDYSTVVYGRGAALLVAIDTLTGRADDFLRSYCDTFAFRYAARTDFEMHLNEWSGMDLSPLVLDYIDTYMN